MTAEIEFDKWVKAACATTPSGVAIKKVYDEFRKMLKPKLAAAAAMTKAAEIGYGERTRPVKFMEHFLYRKGADLRINLSELFAEDRNIRERVQNEIYRRVLGANTAKEKYQAENLFTPIHPHNIDPVITLKQENYSNPEWKGSLGTYDLKIAQALDFSTYIVAFVTSTNSYQWHPDDKRITQGVHRFGAKMVEQGLAANFAMPAISTGFFVDKRYAEIVRLSTLRQTDPSQGFGQRLNEMVGQASRLAEAIF